ncbi:radical SAM family heme chaperone HemW [Daejeonella oryzae]|uniref:radical SAM family heme chaperone HemW n=1 Tax=Daejeonella oryzae TaxID=1122943 RepID=UPI0004240B43|nr:radical SAM family heme chaperone HemW [Daejeonella oryzae]
MSGIYLHIPFCKKACHYCDFHFSTSPKYKDEMVSALRKELILQKNFLANQNIETIYFGGGTPSLLDADELHILISEIGNHYDLSATAEITLEANPDDLSPQKVKELKQTAINRFSIGIQSFFEEDLIWMNRAHSSKETESSVKRVQDAGFENITVDLIYGYPLLSEEKWISNITRVINLNVPHVSAYSMTVEPATALASFINKGLQQPMNEAQSAGQFIILMDFLRQTGFEHYEISNFAKPGMISRHNSNYWKGIPYLGIGPSAHSFNGEIRSWNIANNSKYLQAIGNNEIPSESEILTIPNQANEYIMTSLRTMWGMDQERIKARFGDDYLKIIQNNLSEINPDWIKENNGKIMLTQEGKLFADHIASELFIDPNQDFQN